MAYIVIAINNTVLDNFGWNGSYFVESFDDETKAIEKAENEVKDRGGKYVCVVYDISQNDKNEVYKTKNFKGYTYPLEESGCTHPYLFVMRKLDFEKCLLCGETLCNG